MFPGRDLVKIEIRPVFADRCFEKRMHVFELFFELGAIFVGVLAEHRYGPFVFASGNLLEVHSVAIEQTVEVRNLRQYPDRPENSERRHVDF